MESISSSIYEYMEMQVPKEDILLEEPMNKHTTFRVGGNALCLIRISEAQQLIKLVPYFEMVELPYFILGNGSNLLVGDRGYQGVILQIGNKMNRITVDGTQMKVEAGAFMSQAAQRAMEEGLTGLEFASGIPGTVGGGVVMNAGAYGGEMKQIVKQVTVMDHQGEILVLDNDCMEFGYRSSIIKNRPFVVLEVIFELERGDSKEIRLKMEELNRKRKEKQPLEYASAGSTFKRPEGYFAGKLIMDAGLRGYSIGGARVSDKHCGFVINTGNATAEDIAELIREIQECVKDKLGVRLEREVIFLGDF